MLPRSYRDDPIVWLNQITCAGEQVGCLRVHDDEHGLEAPEHPIRPPVLGELDGRALEIAAILLQLGLEPRKKSERVSGGACETRQDSIVVEPPYLSRVVLDDGGAEGHLPVARHHRLVAVAHGQNCSGLEHGLFGAYQRS